MSAAHEHKIMGIDSVGSVNTYAFEYAGHLTSPTTIYTREQTAGRGQRGNSWHSSPGLNLTAATYFTPANIPVAEQFAISELVALALLRAAMQSLPSFAVAGLTIKWPNDIYYHDRKLAGILIEHSISSGVLSFCVAGIGLNIQERSFPPAIPNPVSLSLIAGVSTQPEEVLQRYVAAFDALLPLSESADGRCELHELYLSRLYRRNGLYAYNDASGSFYAAISDVGRDGRLYLRLEDGSVRAYVFKEIRYLIF